MIYLASLTSLAGPDMIVILLIVLVLFGAKRLPELAKGMGQAMKEFQKAKSDFSEEIHFAASPKRPRDAQAVVIAPSDSAADPPV